MGIKLRGANRIDWAPPSGMPSGFEALYVYSGQQGSLVSAAIEIAVVKWTKPGVPTRDVLGRLHSLRVNRRVTPVVLVVEVESGAVVLFGPNSAVAPMKPLAIDQAERILQAVLDEPNPVAARTRLSSLVQSLETTSIAGVKNSGLFANHELKEGVPHRADWVNACEASLALLPQRDHELIEHLGYRTGAAGAHALVLFGTGPRPEAIAVMLEDSETFDADSQRFSISPVAYGLKMAEQTGVSWLILSRRSQLRLYPARIDLGVGRKGLAETFLEVDLPQLTGETAGYLTLIFSASALAEGGSAFEIMHASSIFAVALGERLRDKVYEDIVPKLSLSVAKQLVAHRYEMDAEGLDLAYQLTLRIFFRMLFQTYAEDRKLLPFGENEKYDRNALKTVALDLVENPDQPFDPESTSLWDDLAQVWRVIDKGDKAWGVPAYNGGLFASDPELNEHGAIIETISISNDVIGPCLKALLLDNSDDGEFGPIDFRSLSVREFGTIYEGLLESSLGLAEVDLTLDKDGTWLPAKEGDSVEAAAGEVYFHNNSGQRKGTGSYFTPTFVVEHLLERALDPALGDHLERVSELLKVGDQAGAAELFFDFRVADLAMGSGHFLTAAIDHIEQKMAAFLEEDGHQIPGVVREIILLGNAARVAVGDPDGSVPEGSSLLRRQIARRCIYGLDINPISVELARVAIWIHTFVRGLPMSSLDHNLVCANSLTGIGSIDEALDVLVPGRNGAATFFDAPIEDALRSAQHVLADVALMPEIDRKETQAASRAIKKARWEAEEAKLLFDAAVLERIGRGDLVDAVDPGSIAQMARSSEAQEVLAPLVPGHMPVLFPEVFLRQDGGFDVLIGNPPWEKLHVEEDAWWATRFPGLRGLSQKDKNERLGQLKTARPDLTAQYEIDVVAAQQARKMVSAGPYPGIGEAHVDLFAAFSWRNWQMVRQAGFIGIVLPRNALSGSSCEEFRREVLRSGSFNNVCFLTNNREWVFKGVHPQYTIALAVIRKKFEDARVVFSGPFATREAYQEGRDRTLSVAASEFETWTTAAAFLLIHDLASLQTVEAMMRSPRFSSLLAHEMVPVQGDVNSTNEKKYFDFDIAESKRDTPVLTGASINAFDANYGPPYAFSAIAEIGPFLIEKARRQASRRASAFYGRIVENEDDLQFARARVAYRRTTRATDSQTTMAALVPPRVLLTEQAPFLVTQPGGEENEALFLAVFNSRPFDWLVRRLVELNLSFQLLSELPFPSTQTQEVLRRKLVSLSGRLAASDRRFAVWASAVGVPIGSVSSPDERFRMIAEIDAIVAYLYGLSRNQVEHVFVTFHRGWDYQPRLTRVLEYFDQIEVA